MTNYICIKNCSSYTGKKYKVGDEIQQRDYLNLAPSEREKFQLKIKQEQFDNGQPSEL